METVISSRTAGFLFLVSAFLVGPVLVVFLQNLTLKRMKATERKERLYEALLESRGLQLSAGHVEAVNRVALEFYDRKRVLAALEAYIDCVCRGKDVEPDLVRWNETRLARLDELLREMAVAVGRARERKAIANRKLFIEDHLQN